MAINQSNGRGQGNGHGRKKKGKKNGNGNPSSNKKPEFEMKFHPMTAKSHPAHPYQTVLATLASSFGKDTLFRNTAADAKYMVTKLVMPCDKTKPPLKVIIDTTLKDAAALQAAIDLTYPKQLETWLRKVENLDNLKIQVHTKIMHFCTQSMTDRLENDTEWGKRLKNPIELLKEDSRIDAN